MMRRTHENVLAEMLEKVLAYNISQIIRVRKKLSEPEDFERAALNQILRLINPARDREREQNHAWPSRTKNQSAKLNP